MQITSPANQQVKWARRVRDGREPALLFVEGELLVEECLAADLALHAAFYLPSMRVRYAGLIDRLRRRECPVYETGQTAFADMAETVNSQGIVVIASRPMQQLEDLFYPRLGGLPLLVGLDRVSDPGNLGTIVRTAEGSGSSGVVVLRGSTAAFAPKALRAAMGSAFRLPIMTGCEPEPLIDECRSRGLTLVAATADAELDYAEFNWRVPAIVFFGQEAQGVSREVYEACEARVGIPLAPPVESLNVAAAAAAILFEAARQRRG